MGEASARLAHEAGRAHDVLNLALIQGIKQREDAQRRARARVEDGGREAAVGAREVAEALGHHVIQQQRLARVDEACQGE